MSGNQYFLGLDPLIPENQDQQQMDSQRKQLDPSLLEPNYEGIGYDTVANWPDYYPTWNRAGEGLMKPWPRQIQQQQPPDPDYQHYLQILANHGNGYLITDKISLGDTRHDHHIMKVCKLVNNEPTDQFFACKIVSLAHYRVELETIDKSVEAFRKEAYLLLRMNHNNIIKALDFIELSDRQTGFPFNYCAFTMELMDGHLNKFMKSFENWCLPEYYCRLWVRDISNALFYMQTTFKGKSYTVSHMSLNPTNIVYKVYNSPSDKLNPQYIFKLVDFEECFIYENNEPDLLLINELDEVYTQAMSAPEMDDPSENTRTHPNDMYSLGKTLDYSFCGSGLWRTQRFEERYAEHCNPQQAQYLMYDFIRKLTVVDPEARLTALQALHHPWLNPPAQDHFM
ncbi:uncharacterized protein LOC128958684 [Oppia nitens]|uniref:uncharacterized protein LOC128958684 n=1 Tax=Oppia nitens TaxID=1686743 RepID=UPI0023DB4F96|nr:uncharacterized protein LOC128958684 [Oppia nitens]